MEVQVIIILCSASLINIAFSSPLQGGNDDKYVLYSNQSAKYWASGSQKVSWSSAESICERSGGSLAYPRTEQEAELLASFFEDGTSTWVYGQITSNYSTKYDGVVDLTSGSKLSMYEYFRLPHTSVITNVCITLISESARWRMRYEEAPCHVSRQFVCRKLVSTEDSPDWSTTDNETDYTESPSTPPTPLSHRFRADYVHDNAEVAYYKVHDLQLSWRDANASCTDEGAELMYPRSPAELQLMQRLLESKPQVWLGAHSQNTFYTIDGRPSSALSTALLPELPLDFAVSLWEVGNGRFKWLSTSAALPFVCRKRDESLILDVNCDTTVPGYERSPDGRSCYKVHGLARLWREAHRSCQAEHATLVVVNSRSEAEYLIGLARLTDEQTFVFIGFHDLIVPYAYETVNGKSLRAAGYNIWWENSHIHNNCGGLRHDATLDNVDCDTKAIFICEKEL